MSAEIRYIAGCPSWRLAEGNLRAALRRSGRTDEIALVEVATPEQADAIGFAGSPTVLIDGRDPFGEALATGPAGAGHARAGTGLACRTYQTPAGPAGAPTVAQLVAVLAPG